MMYLLHSQTSTYFQYQMYLIYYYCISFILHFLMSWIKMIPVCILNPQWMRSVCERACACMHARSHCWVPAHLGQTLSWWQRPQSRDVIMWLPWRLVVPLASPKIQGHWNVAGLESKDRDAWSDFIHSASQRKWCTKGERRLICSGKSCF